MSCAVKSEGPSKKKKQTWGIYQKYGKALLSCVK